LEQVPPAFSAIKIDGKRAYKLARDGKPVEINPRKVAVYSLENIKYSYPKLSFDVSVSSGTYVRSLARDIGKELGTGSYLSGLRRTTVGEYDISDAVTVEDFSPDRILKA